MVRIQETVVLEARTVAVVEVLGIDLAAVRRVAAAAAVLHTVRVVVPRTVLVEVARHTVLVVDPVVARIGHAGAHHIGLEGEAAGPIVAAEVELRTGPEEVVLHTG